MITAAAVREQAIRAQRVLARATLSRLRVHHSPLLEKAAKLGEENDPEKTIRELFGYSITPDAKQGLYALRDAVENGAGGVHQVLAYGAHSTSKTWTVGGGGVFGHYWYARGARLDANGESRGALLVLLANKIDQVQKTSWKTIREHAELSAKNGHPIIGDVPPVGVSWRASTRPYHWTITAQGFRPPAAAAGRPVQSAEAGLHHAEGVLLWTEEIDLMPESMKNTARKWGLSLQFGAFNPYIQSPEVMAMIDGGEWLPVQFSALRLPNVLNRDAEAVPGLVTHLEIESNMRNAMLWRNLGPDATPDPTRNQIPYALPPTDMPDRPGPRPDGIPGHPDAEVVLMEPLEMETAAVLGDFSAVSESLVFAPAVITTANRLWNKLPRPTWSPRIVAIDTAQGGPDRFILEPQYGKTAFEIWRSYQSALDRKVSAQDALKQAVMCSECHGGGCKTCWGGLLPFYLGRPRELSKDPDPEEMATIMAEPFGKGPLYKLDRDGGGWYLQVPLRRIVARVEGIGFGTKALQHKGLRKFANHRAFMYGVIAAVSTIGGAAIPPSALGSLERELIAGFGVLKWEQSATGDRSWKLQEKPKVARILRIGSPDVADSAATTEGREKQSRAGAGTLL